MSYAKLKANYQYANVYTRDLMCVKYCLVIGQLCLSMHEEQAEGFVGILSGNTCLCLQMFRHKRVEYSYTVYIC